MKPISLTLNGFRGIRDGMGLDTLHLDLGALTAGAQLVALVGRNGRGKTTVLDNLTPYLTMPSRANADGGGNFSYYEHVSLPESQKELVWEHEGRRYRTNVVVRINGRKKTEAFLHEWTNGWQAVVLSDGTRSDGRIETYTHCVEALLGSPRTFFVSAFAAQGRRQLCTYANGEIKTLLADMLGLDAIVAMGSRSVEVAKQLRAGLVRMRAELAMVEGEIEAVSKEEILLARSAERATAALIHRDQCSAAVMAAERATVSAEARVEQDSELMARRRNLERRLSELDTAEKTCRVERAAQRKREMTRSALVARRIAQRVEADTVRRTEAGHVRSECDKLLCQRPRIEHAARRLALAEIAVESRAERLDECRRAVQVLREARADRQSVEDGIASIEREAGQIALRVEDAKRRACLTSQVPCHGTDLQGRCRLLADARDATTQIVTLNEGRESLWRRREDLLIRQREIIARIVESACAEQLAVRAKAELECTTRRMGKYKYLASRLEAVEQAEMQIARLDAQLVSAAQADAALDAEDARETVEATECLANIGAQEAEDCRRFEYEREATLRELDAMPQFEDGRELDTARTALAGAKSALELAEDRYVEALRDAQREQQVEQRQYELAGRRAKMAGHVAIVEDELGHWNLLAKCFSNDGLIALSIDDAGPTLSALANDLLLACHGQRFSVAIHTQTRTAAGQVKEGFEVMVHDGETGSAKSVSDMSGGERVWINECLTRAIALYLAQHAGRRYETLFSDESDGALDTDRKRMFMAMKREVLRIGGYGLEIFVSQTPELAHLADAVIDLDKLAQEQSLCQSEQGMASDSLLV